MSEVQMSLQSSRSVPNESKSASVASHVQSDISSQILLQQRECVWVKKIEARVVGALAGYNPWHQDDGNLRMLLTRCLDAC